jgi:hypothetical protein
MATGEIFGDGRDDGAGGESEELSRAGLCVHRLPLAAKALFNSSRYNASRVTEEAAAAEMARHHNSPLTPQIQQPKMI